MHTPTSAVPVPWYREPWPWLLMAGPAIVVAAGFATLGFAIASFDGLVADDFRKEGKAIHQQAARDRAARELGYAAGVALSATGEAVVRFAGPAPGEAEVVMWLHHPTRAELDRRARLVPGGDAWRATFADLPSAHWRWTVGDAQGRWRLTGDLAGPAAGR